MKKVVLLVIIGCFFSCKNKEVSTITPSLEKELCENVYLNTPKKGNEYIVKTFIDSTIQNTSNKVLSETLKEYDSEKGFVVVMETNTGKIKGMVSLEKDKYSKYIYSNTIDFNVPVEPGSLIKTFDVMSLIEDNKADTSSVYNANGGEISLYGQKIVDGHLGFKELSLSKAFLYSSNTVFVQAIDSAYGQDPTHFVNNFDRFGLNKDLGLPFSKNNKGSVIPTPKSTSWSKLSLPWMAFGYGLNLTPIQILTYYNSIANGGVMVKPLFLYSIESKSGETKEYSKTILNNSICSKKTIRILQDLLRKVIIQGTGRINNSNKIEISGKSSTTKINYSDSNAISQYNSSFVGYFPSNKPKYTVLVYVKNPKKEFYGAIVAGSVGKKIAEMIK
jgi:cell division protein FtsI (penicillin-binding protein 3)